MAEILTDYIEGAASLKWCWGAHDCALWVADYVLRSTGLDAGASFRGRYATRLGCERLVKRCGGLQQLMTDTATGIGLKASSDPVRGGIGVILAPVARRAGIRMEPTAAICLGRSWAVFSPVGLIVQPARPLVSWII